MVVRFGIRIPPCGPVTEIGDAVRLAEELGFHTAWIPDSQMLWRDAYVAMAMAAVRTERITIGSCVSNVVTRHESVTASALNTLEELAPGRIVCGLGIGGSALKQIGLPLSTRARMKEAIDAIRAWQGGQEVTVNGQTSKLKDARGASPVYFASTGPKNQAFAGEIADGVILLSGFAPEILEKAVGAVRTGVERAGRATEDVRIVAGTYCYVTDDIERDARLLKPIACNIAQVNGQDYLRMAGIDLPNPGPISGVHPDMNHAEDWDAAVERAGDFVTDEMALRFAEKFCLFGNPDQIKAKIDAAEALGVTDLYVRHVGNYDVPESLMRDLSESVLPAYADTAA